MGSRVPGSAPVLCVPGVGGGVPCPSPCRLPFPCAQASCLGSIELCTNQREIPRVPPGAHHLVSPPLPCSSWVPAAQSRVGVVFHRALQVCFIPASVFPSACHRVCGTGLSLPKALEALEWREQQEPRVHSVGRAGLFHASLPAPTPGFSHFPPLPPPDSQGATSSEDSSGKQKALTAPQISLHIPTPRPSQDNAIKSSRAKEPEHPNVVKENRGLFLAAAAISIESPSPAGRSGSSGVSLTKADLFLGGVW